MGTRRLNWRAVAVLISILSLSLAAFAAENGGVVSGGGPFIQFNVKGGAAGYELTLLDTEGNVIVKKFTGGRNPVVGVSDLGENPLDGPYNFSLRAVVNVPADVQARLAAAREKGNDAEIKKIQKEAKLGNAEVLSGTITLLNGGWVNPNGKEEDANDSAAVVTQGGIADSGVTADANRPSQPVAQDQVIPDDLIVQSSTCTGFDCINGESFGFDTLRLKENNLRIHFDDTSTSAGFPNNDWRIIANDSASGGANKFVVEDSTAAVNPFTIEAAAPANALYIDSTGNIGMQQSAPGLDFHMTESDTPAIRLEQTNAGGFTAQTWDIGGNEANFFIRDLTGGSKLSFRIRPGAPTSSIDIAADGDVGIGTGSPATKLDVQGTVSINNGGDLGIGITAPTATVHVVDSIDASAIGKMQNSSASGFSGITYLDNSGNARTYLGTDNANSISRFASFNTWPIVFYTNNVERVRVDSSGRVGIGAGAALTQPFQVGTAGSGTGGNGAHVTAGGVWTNGSSRAFKEHIEDLSAGAAISALSGLKPVVYNYKNEPGETYVGFIAEDVPELVAQTSTGRHYLSPMDIVATLTKVVQEQQKTIDELAKKVDELKNQQH